MKLINLCPHPVCVKHTDGTETLIPQSGLARVSVAYRENGAVEVAGRPVPLIQGVYGGVEGLPEPEEGSCYLVSHMVRMALPQRRDLLSPANIVRDQQGNILACRMFESNLPG